MSIINIGLSVLIAFIIFSVVGGLYALIKRITEIDRDDPWIIKGVHDAKQRIIITQDPKLTDSITIRRSDNKADGIEFSYSLWFLIDDWNYQLGQWKHIFHKGSANGYPNKCPSVLLHKTENALRISLNTYDKLNEYIDISDIPIGPWVHLAVVVKDTNITIYINGRPVKSRQLSSKPRQNYGELYICDYKGFSGQVAKMRYYNRAISFAEVDGLVRNGPGKKKCVNGKNLPPYLNSKWWKKVGHINPKNK